MHEQYETSPLRYRVDALNFQRRIARQLVTDSTPMKDILGITKQVKKIPGSNYTRVWSSTWSSLFLSRDDYCDEYEWAAACNRKFDWDAVVVYFSLCTQWKGFFLKWAKKKGNMIYVCVGGTVQQHLQLTNHLLFRGTFFLISKEI